MRLSVHRIKAFKSCRRKYQLHYIEGLSPVQKSEALEVGSNYHELLEWLNKNGSFDGCEEDYSKAQAMASAYSKYIYPKFHVTEVEKWIELNLNDDGDKLVGKIDAIADDGHIVEHKSVGSEITEQYEYDLQWDEQILTYMLLTGQRKVWYTVCRKPTIRQKQNESDEEFYHRMVEWYNTDTDSKIRLFEITRTDKEVEEYREEVYKMLQEMKEAKNFYKNTCHCNMWNRRCDYSSICLNYDPNQEYIEFVKGEEYEPEKD